MSHTYYYNVSATNIDSLLAELNNKIIIDLDLSEVNLESSIFNDLTSNIEITFSSSLNEYQLKIVSSLIIILFSNEPIENNVYVVFENYSYRCSFSTTNSPTINHDITSGYRVGSKVITVNDGIYTCINNTKSNAIWVKLKTLNQNTNVHTSTGEVSSLGDGVSTYDLLLSTPNTYNEITPLMATLFTNDSKFNSPQWRLTIDNKLQFIGVEPNLYHVFISLSFSTVNLNSIINLQLAKNGVVIPSTIFTVGILTSGNPVIVSFSKIIELITNDYLSIQIADVSLIFSPQTIIFNNINLSAVCCSSSTF